MVLLFQLRRLWRFNCGDYGTFTDDCTFYCRAPRVDTGRCSSCSAMVDRTRALFTQFAPLSQGVIQNMRAMPGNQAVCDHQ